MTIDDTEIMLVWSAGSADAWKRISGFPVVWASETENNRRSAEATLGPDVVRRWTWFTPTGASDADALIAVLELIEDHHGPYAQEAAWRTIEVVGLDKAIVRAVLADDPEFSASSAGGLRIVRM